MIIPHQQLATETLNNIIEAYVLREGTDYGENEYSLAEKVEQIKQQLNAKQLLLVYSELYESVTIITADQYRFQNE